MNFINIDPMLGQMLSQMAQFKSQVEMLKSVDTSTFLAAMSEFSNLIGSEIQKQAMGQSTSGVDRDMSAAILQPDTTTE